MTVTLKLNPEVEKNLMARAHHRGVSLNEYLSEIVAREASLPCVAPTAIRAGNLSDFLLNLPFAGANLDLERSTDYSRS